MAAPAVLERLLSLRERSPLVSVLDSSAQSARPLLALLAKRAVHTNRKVVWVAFQGNRATAAIRALPKPSVIVVPGLQSLRERFALSHPSSASALRSLTAILKDINAALGASGPQNCIVIIDSITPFFLEPSLDPIHFLGCLLSLQPYSVILSHNIDITLPLKFPHYPSSEALLSQISTAVISLSSYQHHLIRLEAESKALPDPIQLDQAKDGVVATLGSNATPLIILALEYRKKSGRTIKETCTLDILSSKLSILVTLDDRSPSGIDFGTTFNLGMTDRQRESKEEVVLPHFSAQAHRSAASDSHAEIEYTLDAEDDFDDEEDVDEDLLI